MVEKGFFLDDFNRLLCLLDHLRQISTESGRSRLKGFKETGTLFFFGLLDVRDETVISSEGCRVKGVDLLPPLLLERVCLRTVSSHSQTHIVNGTPFLSYFLSFVSRLPLPPLLPLSLSLCLPSAPLGVTIHPTPV